MWNVEQAGIQTLSTLWLHLVKQRPHEGERKDNALKAKVEVPFFCLKVVLVAVLR